MHQELRRAFEAIVAGLIFTLMFVTCEPRGTAMRPGQVPEPSSPSSHAVRTSCLAWTSQVLRDDDAGNRLAWRDVTIRSLARACDVVPEPLRVAAARANRMNDERERARILAAAMTAPLGGRCSIAEPFSDARELAKACPPPKGLRFHLDESVLSDIRAVDYGLVLILLQGFLSAGEYNDAAERLVLNFALSAQIFGEDYRKGRPHERRQAR